MSITDILFPGLDLSAHICSDCKEREALTGWNVCSVCYDKNMRQHLANQPEQLAAYIAAYEAQYDK